MADNEVTIAISTDADLSDAETLDDLIQQIREDASDIPINVDNSGLNETASSTQEVSTEADNAGGEMSELAATIEGLAGMAVFSEMASGLMEMADAAGSYNDSVMRASLEAEGAGISADAMKDSVSKLSNETGRAGGQIRESFIKATARGITDMNSFETMMEGAGAQATLFGTDIQSMGEKFSNMAMRSSLMERQLASTGITMDELSEAMGMQGATADEVKDKWKTLSADQRAAILGTAASMNEGKDANDAYKNSWAGLQEKLDIAKSKLFRLAGEVLLPVLVPAIDAVARILDGLGNAFSTLMDGPLGGFISVIGSVVAAIAVAIPAYMGISSAISLLTGPVAAAGSALLGLATGPVGIVIAALIALGVAIFEVGKAFGWWSDVGTMFDALQAGVMELWNAFISNPYVIQVIDLIKQGLTDAWNAVVGFGQAILTALTGGSGQFDILAFMVNNLGMVLNTVGPIIVMAIQGIITAFRMIYAGAQASWPYVASAISTAIGIATGVINAGRAVFNGLVSTWHTVSSTVQSMASAISGALSAAGSAWESFKATVMAAVQPILDAASQVGDAIGGIAGAIGLGGIETPMVSGAGGYGNGSTMVSQGNTIIFNMYGDIRDEKTLDDTIDAINNRINFEALANGVNTDSNGGAI